MPTIHLTTFIAAPAERVFDLSRHIGLHKESMAPFSQEAVAGTRFGLIEKDETVTWKSKHLFRERMLRVKVTEMSKPSMFVQEQAEGNFRMMKHEHYFKPCDNGTIVIDLFHFESPYGVLGRWFNELWLTRYLRKIIELRNNVIKQYAETGKWKKFLDS
ncbi:MAG: SRPBCC family protein [Chitinophagaceae bacterium]|nr:SRPBCC family protein [Chitinophagaceae bacterium]